MPAFVRETSGGWEVVDGARVVAKAERPAQALDAALLLVRGERTKPPMFHANGVPNGAWRWFDAAAEEATPLRGYRHDATTIEELVESLNALSIARPIDGGVESSEHGTEIVGSDTYANGWAHWAVLVERADGQKHAATFAEVHPATAPAVDDGRLAFLSIATRGKSSTEDAAIRGASWSSAAFTNKPGNHALTPNAAMRTEGATEVVAHRTHRLDAYAHRQETHMEKTPPTAVRAEVADADLAALCKVLGLEAGASVADMIKAAEAKGKPAEEPKPEAMKTEPAAAAVEAARSEKLTALETEVASLRAERVERETSAWLDGEIAKRKVAVRAESREKFLVALRADPKGGQALVSGLLDTIPTPPTGQVVKGGGETDPTAAVATDVTEAAINAELVAVRSAYPKDPAHMQWARARKAARAKDPRFAAG